MVIFFLFHFKVSFPYFQLVDELFKGKVAMFVNPVGNVVELVAATYQAEKYGVLPLLTFGLGFSLNLSVRVIGKNHVVVEYFKVVYLIQLLHDLIR